MPERTQTILLVDDEPHVLRTVGDLLIFKGYDVDTVSSGPEALEYVRKHHPDLILLDIMMPGMDGGEVAQIMRKDDRLATVPIIYLTAVVRDWEVRERAGLIADEVYVAKSAGPAELLAEIERQLS